MQYYQIIRMVVLRSKRKEFYGFICLASYSCPLAYFDQFSSRLLVKSL